MNENFTIRFYKSIRALFILIFLFFFFNAMISIPMEKIPDYQKREGEEAGRKRELLCSSQRHQGRKVVEYQISLENVGKLETSTHTQPPEHSSSDSSILNYGKLAATEAREREMLERNSD